MESLAHRLFPSEVLELNRNESNLKATGSGNGAQIGKGSVTWQRRTGENTGLGVGFGDE